MYAGGVHELDLPLAAEFDGSDYDDLGGAGARDQEYFEDAFAPGESLDVYCEDSSRPLGDDDSEYGFDSFDDDDDDLDDDTDGYFDDDFDDDDDDDDDDFDDDDEV